MIFFYAEEVVDDEDDISTEKETEIESSWIQKKNAYIQWKKGVS